MFFTVEIPDNAENIRVAVLCDGKPCCQDARKAPGYWNGIDGGRYYGQYFDMDDVNRVQEMTEVASVLTEYGINYAMTKFKRHYRIVISRRDYENMREPARERIRRINERRAGNT